MNDYEIESLDIDSIKKLVDSNRFTQVDYIVPWKADIMPIERMHIVVEEGTSLYYELENRLKTALENDIGDKFKSITENKDLAPYIRGANSVNEVTELNANTIKYSCAYIVKLKKFKYPFIAIRYFERKYRSHSVVKFSPTAISRSDFDNILISEDEITYEIREDSCFDFLISIVDNFKKKLGENQHN